MSQGAQAIDRAAELLSYVIHAEHPVTYTELVDISGLPRSTVSRMLSALERGGLLEKDPEGAYRGGAMFAHYANRHDRVEALVTVAQPYLERVAERTGETVNLGVPRGDTVVHAAQIDSRYVVGATSWADIEVPPHCSALGKVMYAFGAIELPSEPLTRCTPASITTLQRLREDLDTVCEVGFAVTSGEFEEGLDAIAAPVWGSDGHVEAALGVSGPSFRMEENHDEFGVIVVTEADRLSQALRRLGR